MKKWITTVIVLNCLVFAGAAPAVAAEIEGVTFEERLTVSGQDLDLRGMALLQHLIVIKAYVGALYLPEGIASGKVLTDVPKALVLHYFHAIPAADFAKATTAVIEENTSKNEFKALKSGIDQMNALYRDVDPGDEYQAAYIPGVGTSLALNGKELGIVPGPKFARAYFAMWLGANPISRSFRDGLLGR